MNEVQLIKTVAVTGEKIGGYFTLRFDTTAHGGSIEESGPILFNAGAEAGDGPTRTSMQEVQSLTRLKTNHLTFAGVVCCSLPQM